MSQPNGESAPVAQEKINTDIVTLTRFLTEEQKKHKEATGDFTSVSQSKRLHTMQLLIQSLQTTVPRSTVFFQIHRLLHPASDTDQSYRPGRLLEHNGR